MNAAGLYAKSFISSQGLTGKLEQNAFESQCHSFQYRGSGPKAHTKWRSALSYAAFAVNSACRSMPEDLAGFQVKISHMLAELKMLVDTIRDAVSGLSGARSKKARSQ